MKRLFFLLAVALVLPAVALAKGPTEATVTGPGLGGAITLKGLGDSSRLVEYAGFFPAAFGQQPSPMLSGRPSGELGPRYTIHYLVPTGTGTGSRIVQDVYPYAKGGAVTYMRPGQDIFDSKTTGGWYRGGLVLWRALVGAGLPATAPSVAPAPSTGEPHGGSGSVALFAGIGALGVVLLAGLGVFLARRHGRPAHAA
jgi:hypothetical protein